MGEALRILILEDVPTDAALEEFELQEAGVAFTSRRVMTEQEYIRELQSFAPDLILSDYDLPQYNGARALAEARTRCPDTPFILVTGAVGEDRAIEILTQGAKDYVLKNRLNRLVPAVQRALEEAEAHRARKRAEEALRDAHRLLEKQVEARTAELRAEIVFRKRVEESLRRSEANLRLALEASGQGIWDWNLLEEELTWSDQCRAIFGLGEDAAVSHDAFLQLIHPEDRERVKHAISQALEGKEDYDVEMRVLRPGGAVHWVASKGRGIYNEAEKPVRMIGVTRDITARRRLESDLVKARELEAVGTLAGGIAHDFNNLLAIIQGHVDLARIAAAPSSRISERLLAVEGVVQQAAELTGRLITFAKGGEPEKRPCDMREMIRESVEGAVAGLPLQPTYDIADDLWLADIDEGQIRQVIRSLTINATEAMPEGGSLRIGAANIKVNSLDLLPVPDGAYVRISVEDKGMGISEQELPHIFDPYFSTKERGMQKGMGLGLSVCHSIISKHHGCMTVTSRKGEGTTFYVYLPVLIDASPLKARKTDAKPVSAKSRRRVLVMDDEVMIRQLTEQLLTASGYDVEMSAEGQEAIERYLRAHEADNPFDLVILDLSVRGGLGGMQTLKRLQEIDPQVRAIISSGYSEDPVIQRFRDYGFIGAIAKPFTLAELTGVLDRLI